MKGTFFIDCSLTVERHTTMKLRAVLLFSLMSLACTSHAHDFGPDIARFQQLAVGKRQDSKEAIQARLALERAQGVIDQADIKMLLRIRSLTNTGLKELGEQPAFVSSEIKRLEAALASPKTSDPARIARAREIFAVLSYEKPVYEAMEREAEESMRQALKLIESAPGR